MTFTDVSTLGAFPIPFDEENILTDFLMFFFCNRLTDLTEENSKLTNSRKDIEDQLQKLHSRK